jgi:hypothetical protein
MIRAAWRHRREGGPTRREPAGVVRLAAALGVLLAAGAVVAAGPAPVELGFTPPAEPGAPPPGWEALTFPKVPRHTRYSVVRDGDRYVLRAESEAAASALYHPLDLDPRTSPVLAWRWKVQNVVERGDARRKEGDDYAARVYVAFRHDPASASLVERARLGAYRLLYGRYPPRHVLNYIWDSRLPPGTILPNAYTDRARMIVVQSGAAGVGRWIGETRNVLEDYRQAFGGDPPPIEGVAVMTDTDDTGDRAVAWYDTLVFGGGARPTP